METPETETLQLNADGPLDSEMPRLVRLALRRAREGGITRFLDGEKCVAELRPPGSYEPSELPFNTMEVPFTLALSKLINWYNLESGSNTPDHILAIYLFQCLKAFDAATESRNAWYGVNLSTELADPQ